LCEVWNIILASLDDNNKVSANDVVDSVTGYDDATITDENGFGDRDREGKAQLDVCRLKEDLQIIIPSYQDTLE